MSLWTPATLCTWHTHEPVKIVYLLDIASVSHLTLMNCHLIQFRYIFNIVTQVTSPSRIYPWLISWRGLGTAALLSYLENLGVMNYVYLYWALFPVWYYWLFFKTSKLTWLVELSNPEIFLKSVQNINCYANCSAPTPVFQSVNTRGTEHFLIPLLGLCAWWVIRVHFL